MSATDRGMVNVELSRLDRLLNLVGELVITRSMFVDQARIARSRYGFKEEVLDLIAATEQVGRLGEGIQSKIIEARLVPVRSIFNRFKPLIEAYSAENNSDVKLKLVGEHIEVDKRTIDQLAEPLVHLVRNALDHGMEDVDTRRESGKSPSGTIVLEARHEGNRLVVEVRDDGVGIDPEQVKDRAIAQGILTREEAVGLNQDQTLELLFRPGFSTSLQVTNMSGRGVGMDAARRRVEVLGGVLGVTSVQGEGFVSRIVLPLTTAIVPALKVAVGEETFALPLEHVHEIVRPAAGEVSTVEGRQVLDLRGIPVSLVYLSDLAEAGAKTDSDQISHVVVVRFGDQDVGLVVDRIIERHEIVIKALGKRLAGTRGLAGASIGSDGRVVLVLDVETLCNDAIAESAAEQAGE